MADQPSREKQIYIAALQLATREERAAYLKDACAGDAALRQRVEALLQAYDQAGNSLDPDLTVKSAPSSNPPVAEKLTEKPGDRINRYKLLQEIGEGGCGVVYMAEQEEPVRRRVALKVIKLGMDTKQVIARFEAERQALALMDHPNIAKVLDAGATETGRPFFVMELVRGVPITEYCDQNNLSTHQRLDLFVEICRAIQHAHQKGIIHRDIKPSNILVTLHDGVPVPKVIDFGIAKATTGQRLTDKTLFTAFEQFIGTPAYMSPEQAEMSGLDIDTRSDIYALGVLLYELLTGRTPFDARRLVEAGIEEIRRIIREEEPPRPSTRISTLDASEQTTVAKCRGSEPPKLIHMVRGDLDWIVMKAMEKDRTRRYETANGLAMDVTRYLNSEPVVARPPSNLYRFQKLVRRNKLAFAATTAVATALVLGAGVSVWQAVRATRAEREQKRLRAEAQQAQAIEAQLRKQAEANENEAKTEAAKSQQVTRFLEDMLDGVGPSVALGRDTTMLREILDKTAERIGKELKNQPEVDAELRNTVGVVYRTLRQYNKAEQMLREAVALRRKLFGEQNLDVAVSLGNLAFTLWQEHKAVEAETLYREVLSIQRRLLGNENPQVADSLNGLGNVLHLEGKLAEAESTFRESLATKRKVLGDDDPSIGLVLYNLSLLLRSEGKLGEVEAMYREDLTTRRKDLPEEHPELARSFDSLVGVLRVEGKLAEVKKAYCEAAERGDPQTLNQVAWMLATCDESELRDGLAAVRFSEKAVAATDRRNPAYLDTLAAAYAETGRFDKAIPVQKEAITALGTSEKKNALVSRLQLYESNTTYRSQTDICGYRIDQGDVIFDFDPRVFSMSVASNAVVMVAGEFNGWLGLMNGQALCDCPDWVMQRMDEDHYSLHKKITYFRSQSQWQFKFIINRSQWIQVSDSVKNRNEFGGFVNLVLTIPPQTNSVAATNEN
jgi:eukaryotic-like serine/threonine-protein kinase